MIKRLTLCFLLTCLYVPCFSQERFVVRGRILDAESAPVPYCSVSILESRDSTVLGSAVSDAEGRYSLHFEQAGRYLLCYDHLAYESCYRAVEVPEAQTLPDVILRPASQHIDEVVVVARNTEYRAGRYEVNMLGNPIVRNRSVMQVLDLLPGLRVSGNTLSIKGTPVSVVYIDDRLVTDLGELSALRAEDVKSVEVQNKTGAAYSATTSGGIVRIRLKKLAAGSFYGNVSPSASVSRDGYSTGLALPFSAQCGRLGIYNYVSGSYGENETLDRTYSEFRNSGYSLDSEDRGRITFRNIRELLSLVYKINDRHSIGLGGQIFMGASDPSNTVHTTSAGLAWGDVPPQMPEAGYTLYRYGGTLYNRQYQGSLNYIFRFDTLGSRLSFKADYLHQNVDRNYDYDTRDFSRPEDAEPFSTELRRERYKLLGHLFASRLDSLSDKINVKCAFDIKRWEECVRDYSYNLLILLSKVGYPDFNTIDGVFILKNLLDAVGIDMSMDDTDKFIAAIIGCPISTVTTYRNKFNEWGRKADEARLSKLQTIQGLSEALLNPEGKNEQNQVVKKFLSSIGKTVRDAKEASKKKK